MEGQADFLFPSLFSREEAVEELKGEESTAREDDAFWRKKVETKKNLTALEQIQQPR